jgi:hypothetical protein
MGNNILQTEGSHALVVVGGRLPPIDAPSARYEALHIGGGSKFWMTAIEHRPAARHARRFALRFFLIAAESRYWHLKVKTAKRDIFALTGALDPLHVLLVGSVDANTARRKIVIGGNYKQFKWLRARLASLPYFVLCRRCARKAAGAYDRMGCVPINHASRPPQRGADGAS